MEFLLDYGLFLAKAATVVIAVILVAGVLAGLSMRQREQGRELIEITRLNDRYRDMARAIEGAVLGKAAARKQRRADRKARKRAARDDGGRKRMFVIDFEGDLRASRVSGLREEITAILTIARGEDEVVVKIESGGGMVHAYGLAASQLDRLRAREIPLTVCVDKVAASGGYLMACVANHLMAAPFAIVGSIGVVAQLPNFNRLLKRHDVDFEQITAGEYKRTLTLFGENTDSGREKMREDLEQTHRLFKDFITTHRPNLDVDSVATGEYWLGTRARELGLVDALGTSDDLLMAASESCDILAVRHRPRQNLVQKLAKSTARLAGFGGTDRTVAPHLLV